MKPNLCIYHGNCADGFTAAWVLRNALGEDNVDFVPGFYHESFDKGYAKFDPNYENKMDYECVYIVDFSYKRPVLLDLAAEFKKIVIIDHHKTAQQDLVDLPANVECHFDMDHSGAMLTWLYFSNPELSKQYDKNLSDRAYWIKLNCPALIQRVEDRDLWRFKFSDTRAVAAKMFSHEYTFENWDRMNECYAHDAMNCGSPGSFKVKELEKFLAEGEAIERKHFKDIKELLAVCQTRGNILGYNVPIANLPYIFSSDAGHIMAEGQPFAACYWYTKDKCVFSLRSAEDGIDVSDIAKQFGGGGHKHAAGFELPIDQLPEFGDTSINLMTL